MTVRHHRPVGRGGLDSSLAGLEWAGLAVALAWVATLARGGVGFAESCIIAAGAWGVGAAGMALGRGEAERRGRVERLAGWSACIFAGWCGVQLIPMPASWMAHAWGGDPGLRELVTAGMESWPIAVDRFVARNVLLLWLGLGVLAWAVARRARSRTTGLAILLGLAGLGVFQVLAGVFFRDPQGGRLTGTFGSPDALGGLLAMTLPVTLGLILQRVGRALRRGQGGWRWWVHRVATDWRSWRTLALAGGFTVQWMGLLFSGSIGATLAALTGCMLLLVWHGVVHPSHKRFGWAAAVFLVLVAMVFSLHGHRRNVLDRSLGDADGVWRSQASRMEIWRSSLCLFRLFPLGTGPGGTALVLPMVQGSAHGRYRLDYLHNDTLQFWGDLGPVGWGALAFLLGLVARQAVRACRNRSHGEAGDVWWRRGAAMAFLAGLLHAQGEFGLSARPGIQVPFVLLGGLLWAWGMDEKVRPDVRPATPTGTWRWIRAGLWGAGAAAVALACLLSAKAWRLHEGISAAIGMESIGSEWFSAPALAPEQALAGVRQAIRLAPDATAFRTDEALVRLAEHRRKVEGAARQLLEPFEEEGEPVLDPLVPEHRQALEVAGRAVRVEEVAMLGAARLAAEHAVALAPWDAAARLVRARIRLRQGAILPEEEAWAIQGRRDLDVAVGLYPRDAGVLADACSVLATQGKAADQKTLLEWGGRALALDPLLADTVVRAWRSAGISTPILLRQPTLPDSILWPLYTVLDRQGRSADSLQCLAALKHQLDKESAPSGSSLWTAVQWEHWRDRQARSRNRWVKESLRQALRTGDWQMVQNLAPERRRAADEEIRLDLESGKEDGGTGILRRLRLREWAAQGRLTPSWTVEWALQEWQAGQTMKALQEPLAELLLTGGLATDDFNRLRNGPPVDRNDAPFWADLAEVRAAEEAGRYAEAAARLEPWLDSPDLPSNRFAHRLWWYRAHLLARAGQREQAARAMERAAEGCPTDPDVRGADDALWRADSGESGGTGWEVGYQGGRLRLQSVWIEPSEEESVPGRLGMRWRFLGRLPPDLRVEVRLLDADGRRRARQAVALDEVWDARFNRGAPPLGSTWSWRVSLPPAPVACSRAEIVVISAARRLATEEGLLVLELDLERLPRREAQRDSGAP